MFLVSTLCIIDAAFCFTDNQCSQQSNSISLVKFSYRVRKREGYITDTRTDGQNKNEMSKVECFQ